MKKYKIYYTFEGEGVVQIEAENKEEAEEIYSLGEFWNEVEKTENYNIEKIQEVK